MSVLAAVDVVAALACWRFLLDDSRELTTVETLSRAESAELAAALFASLVSITAAARSISAW